jgi:hypothetical protein
MKSLAVVLLIALATVGGVVGASAQGGNSPGGTPAPAAPAPSNDSTTASGSLSTPGGEVKGQGTIERRSEPQPRIRTDSSRSDDGASALPRAAARERSTVFGLSPTAAVVIAAALLVVVILAIVAMTRSGDTYIDTDRRL